MTKPLLVTTSAPLLVVVIYVLALCLSAVGERTVFGQPQTLNAAEAAAVGDLAALQRALWRGEDPGDLQYARDDVLRRDRGLNLTPAEAAIIGRSPEAFDILIASGLRLDQLQSRYLQCLNLWRGQPDFASRIARATNTTVSDELACRQVVAPAWDLPIAEFKPDHHYYGAPSPSAEQLRRIEDVRRDLLAISRGESGAVTDLSEDLLNMMVSPPSRERCTEVSAALAEVLRAVHLDEARSRKLAELLYAGLHTRWIPEAEAGLLLSAVEAQLDPSAAATSRHRVLEAMRNLR